MSTRIEFTKGLVGKDYFKAEVLSEEEQLKLPIKFLCTAKRDDFKVFAWKTTLIPQIPVVDASLLTKMIRVNFFEIPQPYYPGSRQMCFDTFFLVENEDNQKTVGLDVKISSPP